MTSHRALIRRLAPLIAALIGTLPAAMATPLARPVQLESKVYRERFSADANGTSRRTLLPAQTVERGDRLLFVFRYRNNGAAPVRGYAITSALPDRIALDPGATAGMQVSIDGGRSWSLPGALFRTGADGALIPANGQRITHIRFLIEGPMAPGAEGQRLFRGRLL